MRYPQMDRLWYNSRMTNEVKSVLCLFFAACAISGCRSFLSPQDPDLIFLCTFDSKENIATPAIGPQASRTTEWTLVPGKRGMALKVPAAKRAVLAYNLPTNFFHSAGCIEFWAKIDGKKESMRGWNLPQFFLCRGKDPVASIYLNWNINNGGGGAGLCGKFQHYPATSVRFGDFRSCREYIGGAENDWHHYALVWNFDGIRSLAGESGAPVKVAVYLDGKLTSKLTNVTNPVWQPFGFLKQNMTLGFPDAPANTFVNRFDCSIDDFKIWKTDRTDFAL